MASSDPPTCSSLRLEEKASVANASGDFSFYRGFMLNYRLSALCFCLPQCVVGAAGGRGCWQWGWGWGCQPTALLLPAKWMQCQSRVALGVALPDHHRAPDWQILGVGLT